MRIGNGAVLLLSGLLFTGCLQGNPGVRAPKFLEAGTSYLFWYSKDADWGSGTDTGEVLEYDRKTGWVYVKFSSVGTVWINLNHVVSIRPIGSKW